MQVIKNEGAAVSMTDGVQHTEEDLSMLESFQERNKELQENLFEISMIEGNDTATKFYTGLGCLTGVFFFIFSCSLHRLLFQAAFFLTMMSCS